MTKERPILFSAPMVRALLDGSKTQTRRIAKDIPYGPDADHFGTQIMDWALSGVYQDETNTSPDRWWLDIQCDVDDNTHDEIRCPHGQPGDRLWVRETFGFNPDHPGILAHCCYRADPGHEHDGISWKPSIHMPRTASRILLEIVSVRVERLSDCSEADAVAEGVGIVTDHMKAAAAYGMYYCAMPDGKIHYSDNAVELYKTLWEQINGAGSWAANPWVWVVEFKRIA